LVILRLMEAPSAEGRPLRPLAVLTGGWESRAYQDFREVAPTLVQGDHTEGFSLILQLVFEDLATELPGLYGPVGISDLVSIPAATLRHVVEELDKPELESCWTDDMTLGWVYQYWNDPEREAIDAKLNAGGKVEPHEIASKTQLFTERYMVDWLLQNSLGPIWLAICRKHGWTADVEAPETDGTSLLLRLEARRVEWRAKREAGEVSAADPMPLHTSAERQWAYFLPHHIADDAVGNAPDTVRDLRILDPALGSGHFLVVAMDLLVALYYEEARHRGLSTHSDWSNRAIVERILSHNLHGIDLDPRAVQIAAAALWLKTRQVAPDAAPERMNLVASNLRLASLADDDPALIELRVEIERETGIQAELTDTLVHALRGADHLGSLLKVDRAVDGAIETHELSLSTQFEPQQVGIFETSPPQQAKIAFEAAAAKRSLLDRLETFLARHTSGDDLGLRLRGEQLASGVRFIRTVREGSYDLVIANPPYQGTSKMADAKYVEVNYPCGKADLYAAFILRGLELTRPSGVSSMLTIRDWMFTKQYTALREHLLTGTRLNILCDLGWGAFREMKDVSVAISAFQKLAPLGQDAVTIAPTGTKPSGRTQADFEAKNAGLLRGEYRFDFNPAALKVVPKWPLVYWWDTAAVDEYVNHRLLGDLAPVRNGLSTQNNSRFLRMHWEVQRDSVYEGRGAYDACPLANWVLYIKGAEGRVWLEGARDIIRWEKFGLEVKAFNQMLYGSYTRTVKNEAYYFRLGIAFSLIGHVFTARAHRYRSVFGHMGASVFPSESSRSALTTLLNSRWAREILSALNPGVHFLVGDVERLPLATVEMADTIFERLDDAFQEHESHREPSIDFRVPGPSSWRYAQSWAQKAVDRPRGVPLPPYEPVPDREQASEHASFALGVALRRFDLTGGVIESGRDEGNALPSEILFLDRTLGADDWRDSLGHVSTRRLHEVWSRHNQDIDTQCQSLRDWLALDFFNDVHKNMYENRPIHWPLSSAQKTFVAWVNIHRFTERSLRVLLADHLYPTLGRIEGELSDLRAVRDGADKKAARAAEKQYDRLLKARDELKTFVGDVEQCTDRGAPPTDAKCPPRAQNARYSPDLDDGVMINSAGLWPLLEPQWKDPKKWWKQLSSAKGKKHFDWSHLAMRYWPTRVDEKCQKDPSLGVVHGCFWRYHPNRAWTWELRLQDEIRPDFRIEEAAYRPGDRDLADSGSGPHREAWLRDHAIEALAAVEKEAIRRMGRSKTRQVLPEMRILEEGLWSALPEGVWDLELRLSEKQGSEFRLLSPDEPAARAAFETANPERLQSRVLFMSALVPPNNWFDEPSDEDEAAVDGELTDDADVDAEIEP
jgi:hypothetical protein